MPVRINGGWWKEGDMGAHAFQREWRVHETIQYLQYLYNASLDRIELWQ